MDNSGGDFGTVFGVEPDLTYSQKTIDQINKNRRHLDKELFFDRLMKAVGLDETQQLYPPRSNADVRKLYDAINGSSAPDHHKQSLVYYILKDLELKPLKASDFAAERYIPSKYQTFIDGVWSLDRMNFEDAVCYLAEPSLVATFPEEILYTLCKHCKNNPQLPLAYYHSVMPPIVSSGKTLEALFDTMCYASLTEAYFFAKAQDPNTHRHLFERLLSFVHGSSGGHIRAVRSCELIALPLGHNEESWFEHFLTQGAGKGLYGAKDTIIMRNIVLGRTEEATQTSQGHKERKIDGLDWTSLTKGLQK